MRAALLAELASTFRRHKIEQEIYRCRFCALLGIPSLGVDQRQGTNVRLSSVL